MWGCITWCRSCITIKPFVCVCMCMLPRPKVGNEQALELLAPSSLRSFETQNFTTCSLFPVSLLPCLRCCQLWLLFLLQLQYKSRKRRRNKNNSRTQETSKQKKPKKFKAKKNLSLSTLSNREEFYRIKLKRRKKNIVYVNGGRVIATMSIQKFSLTMQDTLLDKGILEKLTREGKSLALYIVVSKAETLNKP